MTNGEVALTVILVLCLAYLIWSGHWRWLFVDVIWDVFISVLLHV